MTDLLLTVGFGIVSGAILAIAGVGLSLQFGVTNFVNFAYGDYATLGAYFALFFNRHGMSIWPAMVLGAILVGVVSVAVNRIVFKRFIARRAQLVMLLVASLGLSLVIENTLQSIWGAQFQAFQNVGLQQSFSLGPFLLTGQGVVIIGVAVVLMLAVHGLLHHTRAGKAMRAMSDNRDLAEVSGINTEAITDLTWFITGFLAAVSGVVFALSVTTFTPLMGPTFLFLIFAVVILGGIGQIYGAMLGALVIGLVTQLAGLYMDSAYANAIAFLMMIVLLLVRPQGLFAARGRA